MAKEIDYAYYDELSKTPPPVGEDGIVRVHAHTKPHYWIAIRGAEVWNRWARQGATELQIKQLQQLAIAFPEYMVAINRFLALEPLTEEIFHQIEYDTVKYCRNLVPRPNDDIDFHQIVWQKNSFVFRGMFFLQMLEARFTKFVVSPFQQCVFLDYVSFIESRFLFSNFGKTLFIEHVDFDGTIFNGSTSFTKSAFLNGVDFHKTKFKSGLYCNNATFYGHADFSDVHIKRGATFEDATFYGTLDFSHVTCKRDAVFRRAKFVNHIPNVIGLKVAGVLNFLEATTWPAVVAPKRSRPVILSKAKDLFRRRNKDASAMPQHDNRPAATPLDHKAIALGYSQLRRQMQDMKLYDEELFFHAKELEAKAYDNAEAKWKRRLIKAYGFTSDYGLSIARPLAGLAITFVVFFCLYLIFFVALKDVGRFDNIWSRAFYAALHYTFPFIPDDKEVHKTMLKMDNICGKDNLGCVNVFNILRSFHTLFSFLFLFLIGLGIRNRLRMR
jgi:Pentapeptide repeats (9 copies)